MISIIYSTSSYGFRLDRFTQLSYYSNIGDIPVSENIIASLNHFAIETYGEMGDFSRVTLLILRFRDRMRIIEEIVKRNRGFLIHLAGVYDAILFHNNEFSDVNGVLYSSTHSFDGSISTNIDEISYIDETPRHSFKCGNPPPEEHLESLAEASVKLGELCASIKPDIIYAPLRGAYPLLRLMTLSRGLRGVKALFPATSSFMYLPLNGRRLWGHDFNVMMLETLVGLNELRGRMIYIDEIVSGGMINAHTRHMVGDVGSGKKRRGRRKCGILLPLVQSGELSIHVVGVADNYGRRMRMDNRRAMEEREKNGLIRFHIIPTVHLCTEDNVPLLGINYIGRDKGPRIFSAIRIRGFWEAYRRFWMEIEKILETQY